MRMPLTNFAVSFMTRLDRMSCLQGILDRVVEKWSDLETNEREEFRSYFAELHSALRLHLAVDYLH